MKEKGQSDSDSVWSGVESEREPYVKGDRDTLEERDK
jgi:hypothetical protein